MEKAEFVICQQNLLLIGKLLSHTPLDEFVKHLAEALEVGENDPTIPDEIREKALKNIEPVLLFADSLKSPKYKFNRWLRQLSELEKGIKNHDKT